ncbi:hypothetical protein FACUT_6852 [Fusarium acutatum]|uniref:Uncharacterized protein n=1 Tax=Fusarium acutatum TaxID=78861 RepID=A0A8H4JPB3_9HYPO|nr:hypothetical protein FACUT_6852 [Fusarium acutatum]
MASPCLSRLLLIFLVGATHVVAHPMNKDGPAESGSVVVERSPCVKWKPKEENHKHDHVHHGSEEPTVIFQNITVNLDDKDVSKHKPEANGDEESTKTEYPSEVSSKNDKNMGTTHNHKDLKRREEFGKLSDETVKEMNELAQRYKKLSPEDKKKYWRDLSKKAKARKSHQQYTQEQKGKFKKYKGYKPKDDEPKFKIHLWKPTGYKRDEASHHKDELAPTKEKGVEKKRKSWRRCVPWWVILAIEMSKKEKAKKEEEIKKKSNRPPSTKSIPHTVDKTSDAFNKKPIEENETQKKKGSGLNGKKPDSSAMQQKKNKESKQKSEVQPNTASEYPLDRYANQGKKSLAARFLPPPYPIPPYNWDDLKKAIRKAKLTGNIEEYSHKVKEGKLHSGKYDKDPMDLITGPKQPTADHLKNTDHEKGSHTPSERKGDYSQGQEEQTNKASKYSKDEHSNQRRSSLAARSVLVSGWPF